MFLLRLSSHLTIVKHCHLHFHFSFQLFFILLSTCQQLPLSLFILFISLAASWLNFGGLKSVQQQQQQQQQQPHQLSHSREWRVFILYESGVHKDLSVLTVATMVTW